MMWVVFIIAMDIVHKVATSKSVDSHNATLQSESTQHPTSPPTVSVQLTRRCLATAAHQLPMALRMEWVEWVVYTFGFTTVTLVMGRSSA